jgi:hypothetical protein
VDTEATPSVPKRVLLENRVCLTNTLPGRHSFRDGGEYGLGKEQFFFGSKEGATSGLRERAISGLIAGLTRYQQSEEYVNISGASMQFVYPLWSVSSSGVARGYARYALAYPAIPANTSIYTYFLKKAYKCVVSARLKLSCVT